MSFAMRSLGAVILLAASLPAWASSSTPDRVDRSAAWLRFQSIAGAEATVRWSAVDDVPIVIRGNAPASAIRGFANHHAEAIASMFDEQASLFRLRSGIDAFRASEEREQDGIHHLRMIQTYHGIPVRGGQYMVSVGEDGRLRMMGGRSVPDVDAETTPAVGESQAIAAARAAHTLAPDAAATTSLAIEPTDGRDRLVWEVVIGARQRPGEWEVLVDARDGSVVSSRSRAYGATGCAAIFDPSPNVPAREDDFEIADPPAGSGARLSGSLVRVFEENGPDLVVDSLMAPGGCFDFHFDPDSAAMKFDVTNVYWQADHFLREFHGGNGFRGLPQPMTMFVRPFRCGEANTAETIASTVWITAGGCGYKPSSRDGDIIDHEIQHVVNNSFGMEGGLDLAREIYATALHESYANYFSCAAHDDPVYGEYSFGPAGFANCNSDPDEYNYSRRLELGVGILQNYVVGMIWSGALWDIRRTIGPVIDRIALESLSYLSSHPSMHEAAAAILQADFDHHDSNHQAAILAGFARRGLSPDLGVTIDGPGTRLVYQPGTWTAIAQYPGTYSYQWIVIPDGGAAAESVGTAATITLARRDGFTLRLQITTPWGTTATSNLRVRVPLARLDIAGPQVVSPGMPNVWSAELIGIDGSPEEFRWSVRCVDDGCSDVDAGNARTMDHPPQRTSWLRASCRIKEVMLADSMVVEVDVPPVAAMFSAPDELGVGESVEVLASAQGGIRPYSWRWTLGTGSGTVISIDPWARVTGTVGGIDLVLIVKSATGTASAPVVHTISPRGVPLVAGINGPTLVPAGIPRQWSAVFPANPPETATSYQWTSTCLDPGCGPERVGDGPTLTLTTARNIDLDLSVQSGTRSASVHRRIQVAGVPSASFGAPDWLANQEPLTLKSSVTGGSGPYVYRWTRDGIEGTVLGTEADLRVRGDDHDLDLYLTVTSADGLRSDAVRRTIRSGLGPRQVPDHPAFRIDRTVVRAGEELTFTLEGSPGSAAQVQILDLGGREIARAYEGGIPEGTKFLAWSSRGLPSGVYFAAARIAGQRIVRRVTVLR